jgi:hypothetical protein
MRHGASKGVVMTISGIVAAWWPALYTSIEREQAACFSYHMMNVHPNHVTTFIIYYLYQATMTSHFFFV